MYKRSPIITRSSKLVSCSHGKSYNILYIAHDEGNASKIDAVTFIMCHIKDVVRLAMTPRHKCGQSSDDRRSLVHCVVLATLPSLNANSKPPTDRQLALLLGLSLCSYQRIVKAVKQKRASLEDVDRQHATVYSQVIKSKGWTKVNKKLKQTVHEWIRQHPHVVSIELLNYKK